MLSTLLNILGVCASGEMSEQEKAEQERQAAAEQRRLVVEASEQGCNSVFSSGCDELRIKISGKDQDLNSP